MSEEKRLKIVINTGNTTLINNTFEEIYNRYKGLVCFIIAKYIKSKEDVMDVAQDVFIEFFNNALNINTNIKSYLSSMAKNKSLNFIKKNNKVIIVDDIKFDLTENESNLNDYLYKDIISLLKENLNEIEYKIIILHVFDNYTFKEISFKLDIKESSIKTLYFRTLKKCRKIIERKNIL